MKTIIARPLVIICLFFSCTKSVNETPLMRQANQVLQTKYLVKDLDSTILTISMDPVVTCYSYGPGETPQPCDIRVAITCTLSNPINGSILVEIGKLSDTGISKEPNGESVTPMPAVSFSIAPHVKQVTFKSNLTSNDNNYTSGQYRIEKVVVYDLIN